MSETISPTWTREGLLVPFRAKPSFVFRGASPFVAALQAFGVDSLKFSRQRTLQRYHRCRGIYDPWRWHLRAHCFCFAVSSFPLFPGQFVRTESSDRWMLRNPSSQVSVTQFAQEDQTGVPFSHGHCQSTRTLWPTFQGGGVFFKGGPRRKRLRFSSWFPFQATNIRENPKNGEPPLWQGFQGSFAGFNSILENHTKAWCKLEKEQTPFFSLILFLLWFQNTRQVGTN